MENNQPDFLKEYPKAIYNTQISGPLLAGKLPTDLEQLTRRSLEYIIENPNGSFIKTPEDFFERWLNGRIGKKPDLEHYTNCKGFELQLPLVKMDIFGEGRQDGYGELRGLVLASDFGYTGDFDGRLVFAINDINSKRALTYHDEGVKETIKRPKGKKKLEHKPIYEFSDKPEEFPFSSLNPLKSDTFTWTLVNIEAQEVYEALKRIGFVW